MFNTTDTKIHQFLNFNQKIKKDSSFYKTRNLSFPKILRRNNFEIIKKKKNRQSLNFQDPKILKRTSYHLS